MTLAPIAQLERVLARLARALGEVAVAIAPVEVEAEDRPCLARLGASGGTAPACLTGAERILYASYRSPRRRAEVLAGRVAARQAVSHALGARDAAALEIEKDPSGAPCVKGHPALHVSIAHSNAVAVAIAAPFAVGVDVERTAPRPNAFARMFFTEAEHERLAAVPEPEREELLHVLWTRKEAASKVGRWGGRLPFGALDCSGETVTVSGCRIALRSAHAAGYAVSVARELWKG